MEWLLGREGDDNFWKGTVKKISSSARSGSGFGQVTGVTVNMENHGAGVEADCSVQMG